MSRVSDTQAFSQKRAAAYGHGAEGTREHSSFLCHWATWHSKVVIPRAPENEWACITSFFPLPQLAVCTLDFLTDFTIWSNIRFPPVSTLILSSLKIRKKGNCYCDWFTIQRRNSLKALLQSYRHTGYKRAHLKHLMTLRHSGDLCHECKAPSAASVFLLKLVRALLGFH